MTKIFIGTSILAFATALMLLVVTPAFAASNSWNLEPNNGISFGCGGGTYSHFLDSVTNEENGDFTGTGHYVPNPSYTWDISGIIMDDTITFTLVYTGSNAGYTLHGVGMISSDGSIDGTVDNNCDTFAMPADSAVYTRTAEITNPDADEIVFGNVHLTAWLDDIDGNDNVQWAVREGTCAAGTNTVAGNVDGFHDVADWDGTDFAYTWDSTGAAPGMYCFIFNPTESAGDTPIRETREFYVASEYVHGGGQIIEETEGKKKNWLKVSFGGWLANVGELMGDWTLQFHNVGIDTYDKNTFHANEFTSLNFYEGDSATCDDAMNFAALGTLEGEEGWKVIVRAGDLEAPSSHNPDTFRVSLYEGNSLVYDTHSSNEFSDESSCVGTARTGIDNGNLTIIDNS